MWDTLLGLWLTPSRRAFLKVFNLKGGPKCSDIPEPHKNREPIKKAGADPNVAQRIFPIHGTISLITSRVHGKNSEGQSTKMQVRFLQDGDLECNDGSRRHFGCNEIHRCEKITYDDPSRSFAAILFTDGVAANGVHGEAFEPIGDEIYFLRKDIESAERPSSDVSTAVQNGPTGEQPAAGDSLEVASSKELSEVSGAGTVDSGDALPSSV